MKKILEYLMHSRRYALISPCRNEADFAPRTISSVIAQSEPPVRWIIVDDGSTDATPQILRKCAEEHDWVTIITNPPRATRVLGSAVIHAFNRGLGELDIKSIDYLCKLDMDLEFGPNYFAGLMNRMESDPRLASASGGLLRDDPREGLVPETGSIENTWGAAKFYRAAAFVDIGGFVPEMLWDALDGHMARQKGWRARCFEDDPELTMLHLRPEGSSDRGVLRGRRRYGAAMWSMGTDPLFVMGVAARRLTETPRVLGSLQIVGAYARAAMRRDPRLDDRALRRNIQRFQRESLVLGKRRATSRWERRRVQRWTGGTPHHRIAYLVSEYPSLSHTFISSEIDNLRRLGLAVQPISVRQPNTDLSPTGGEIVPALLGQTPLDFARRLLLTCVRSPGGVRRALRSSLFPGGAGRPRFVGLAYLAEAAALVAALDAWGIRHVHVHFANNAAEVARLAQLIAQQPGDTTENFTWSLSMHGLWMHGLGHPDGWPHRHEARFGPLVDKLESAEGVVCIDEQSRQRLHDLAGGNLRRPLRVIHAGVDVDLFSPAQTIAAEGPFTVLFVGRWAKEKDLGTLLRAFSSAQLPPASRLMFVGSGPEADGLRELAGSLNLLERVQFKPATPHQQLASIYGTADVFCMTSLSEGIPVSLMEAMACGLPVVATAVGGIPELVEHGTHGFLAPARAVDEIASHLHRLATDPGLRQRMGMAGRERVVADFDERQQARAMSDFFEEILLAEPLE